MANIPGATAIHAIITDTCRTNRTDDGAFQEAVRRLKEEYDRVCAGWGRDKGVQIHMVLTVERPQKKETINDSGSTG